MKPEDLLEAAAAAVRDEAVDPAAEAAALDRVRRRLAAEATPPAAAPEPGRIRGCEGFRALLPAYLAGALAEPKRILLEDHLRECVPCRRARREAERDPARVGGAVPAAALPGLPRYRVPRWALAAGLAGVVATGAALWFALAPADVDASAAVRTIDGELYRLEGGAVALAAAGERLGAGEVVRTGPASGALLELADGSRVELAERSELSLAERRDGVALRLDRGGLIVEAAKQKRGHLYVETDDCQVAVVGTLFAVRHGDKGSRVSVLEGEVHVDQGAQRAVLRPGDQVSTSARLAAVPVGEDFAWSREADRYRAQAQALRSLGRELDAALAVPGERTSTRLLDLAPADTTVWAGLPNLASSLDEAWELVRTRVAENPALAEWWSERFGASDEAELETAIEHLRALGEQLGDEIAVAVAARTGGEDAPLLLAEVRDRAALSDLLDAEIDRLAAEPGGTGERLVRIADPRVAPPLPAGALGIWLADDLLAASPRVERLAALAVELDSGARPFAGTAFHQRLAAVYAEGAGWLVGLDVAALLAEEIADPEEGTTLERTGLAGVRHLVLQSESLEGTTESRALLAFSGERQGLASWLAAPAPVGALDFVSPNAQVAVAGLFKEPAEMVDDLLGLIAADGGEALERFRAFEAEQGVSLRDDLALALGGDVAFAFDGPWLPTPSWKLVVEVVDPDRLMDAARRLVDAWNRDAATDGRPALRFAQEEAGGHVVFTLERVGVGTVASFLFADGYLVAGPSKTLLAEAVAQRAAGVTLAATAAFRERLPRDGRTDYSGVAWQSLGGSLGTLATLLGGTLSDEQRAQLETAGEGAEPTLAVVYAEADRLEFAATGKGGPLGLSLETLLGLAVRPPQPPAEQPDDAAETSAARDETPTRRVA